MDVSQEMRLKPSIIRYFLPGTACSSKGMRIPFCSSDFPSSSLRLPGNQLKRVSEGSIRQTVRVNKSQAGVFPFEVIVQEGILQFIPMLIF